MGTQICVLAAVTVHFLPLLPYLSCTWILHSKSSQIERCVEREHMKRERLPPWYSKLWASQALALGQNLKFPGPSSVKWVALQQWFPRVVPWSTALTLPGILLEMQILRPHARPTKSKIWGVGQQFLFFTSPPDDSIYYWEPLLHSSICAEMGTTYISQLWPKNSQVIQGAMG